VPPARRHDISSRADACHVPWDSKNGCKQNIGIEKANKINPEKQHAPLKRWKRIEGPNPIPHPKERQRTGEAVSSRHTGNSVAKTLNRREPQGQKDKKEVQKPLVSGGFLVTFSAAKKSLRPQAE
jgi:hypothetical protein